MNNQLNQLDVTVVQEAQAVIEQKTKSFIKVQGFGNFVKIGLQMDAPKELVRHVLVEKETTVFFGDTGAGKTIQSTQWAIMMAEEGKRVIYVNFELSQQQVAQRYPSKKIPDSLFIANIDYSEMKDVNDQSAILVEIEQMALKYGAEVIVIDNLTNLCINSKDGAEAGNLMLQLIRLRMTHGWTMLILAHVPKRKASDPLSLNDLAGSKMISNMADNVIGFNKSKQGKSIRYMIQLKYRSFPIELDSNNVQELNLEMSDGYLHFEYGGNSEERSHLPRSRDEKAELERDIVKELKEPNGLSYRDIADKLDTSLSNVQRVAQKHNLNRGGNKKKGDEAKN